MNILYAIIPMMIANNKAYNPIPSFIAWLLSNNLMHSILAISNQFSSRRTTRWPEYNFVACPPVYFQGLAALNFNTQGLLSISHCKPFCQIRASISCWNYFTLSDFIYPLDLEVFLLYFCKMELSPFKRILVWFRERAKLSIYKWHCLYCIFPPTISL